jgi:hypothetical protein
VRERRRCRLSGMSLWPSAVSRRRGRKGEAPPLRVKQIPPEPPGIEAQMEKLFDKILCTVDFDASSTAVTAENSNPAHIDGATRPGLAAPRCCRPAARPEGRRRPPCAKEGAYLARYRVRIPSSTPSPLYCGILLEAHSPFALGSSMNDGCRLHISRFPAVSRLPAIGCTSQIVRRLFLLNGVEIPKY